MWRVTSYWRNWSKGDFYGGAGKWAQSIPAAFHRNEGHGTFFQVHVSRPLTAEFHLTRLTSQVRIIIHSIQEWYGRLSCWTPHRVPDTERKEIRRIQANYSCAANYIIFRSDFKTFLYLSNEPPFVICLTSHL